MAPAPGPRIMCARVTKVGLVEGVRSERVRLAKLGLMKLLLPTQHMQMASSAPAREFVTAIQENVGASWDGAEKLASILNVKGPLVWARVMGMVSAKVWQSWPPRRWPMVQQQHSLTVQRQTMQRHGTMT